jgi:hypothetical protein
MNLLRLTLFLGFGFGALATPGQDLVGTWEFVSAKTTHSDGTVVEHSSLDLRSSKILNSDYFCVVTRNADGSFRHVNLGPYRVEGNLYTETLEYSTYNRWIGSSPVYKFTLEGDLWTIRTTGGRDVVREEVWRRVKGPRNAVEF